MKKLAFGILMLAIILATALFASQKRPVPDLISGFVEADEIRVGSRLGGRVAAVHVSDGQAVAAGEALVELEKYDWAERRQAAEADLASKRAVLTQLEAGFRAEDIAQAKAHYEQLAAQLTEFENGARPFEIDAARAQVELAEAEAEFAEREYERTESLRKEEASSQGRLDAAISQRKVSLARLDANRAALKLLEEGTRPEIIAAARARAEEARQAWELTRGGYRTEEVDQARAAVAASEANLAGIDRQIEELVIRAPVAGVVEAIDLQPGDMVGANAPALSLIDDAKLWVRAYVPENRLDVTIDQVVSVTADSYPNEQFKGRITFISRRAEFTPGNVQTPEERSKQVFRIKVTLDEGKGKLRPGMPADVWLDPGKVSR